MDEVGLAAGTVKTRYVNVRSVFRAAVRDRVIGVDPTDAIRLPRRRRVDSAMSIPTPKEVGLLMSVASGQARALIALCAFAGLRLGEAAAVQIGDIDLGGKSLKVTRQVQRLTGGAVDVRAPKYGSERVVHLADGLLDLLGQHIAGLETTGGEDWLFTHNGGPPHQNTTGYWWRKALQDAHLTSIRFHDLRHFYASGLIAAGCDVVTVQFALGHAKTSTTLNTCAHLWPSAEDRTRSAAQSIIAASLGTPQADPIHDSRKLQVPPSAEPGWEASAFSPAVTDVCQRYDNRTSSDPVTSAVWYPHGHTAQRRLERAPWTDGAKARYEASPAPMDQIQQLGRLRDQGLITRDEFNAKKAQILGL